MTPDKYREAIAALGLTQVGAARLLDVDERTSRRWANGERPIPGTVARFLTFLLSAGIKPDEVMKAMVPPL